MKRFNTSGAKSSCIPLKNPERVRRGRETRAMDEELAVEKGWERLKEAL